MRAILGGLNFQNLDDVSEFKGRNTTTEMLAGLVADRLWVTIPLALIAIALVLSAVFLPMAFFGGSTGVIYRQFSITIVSAMVLSIAVALIWQQLLKQDGILSAIVSTILRVDPPDWLQQPQLALIALCIIIVWSSMGLNIVIFLAGLESIDQSVIDWEAMKLLPKKSSEDARAIGSGA